MDSVFYTWFTPLMGMGTVFIGLVSLIFITKLMSLIVTKVVLKKTAAPAPAAATPAPAAAPAPAITGEMVAAISAACAEEMGTDVSKIRILSIKKL